MGSDHHGPPSGQNRNKRPPKPKNDVRKKADQLVRDAGLPPNLAWQVARGDMTLNEVLQRMALRDKVESLVNRHDLPKSLATQVAMGQADLEQVLRKRRQEAHLEKWRTHSLLISAMEGKRPVTLVLHGKRWITGVIQEVDRYEFVIQPEEGEAERIHKLHVKFGTDAEHQRELRREVKKDKEAEGESEPVWKPQDRYGCSDKRLFGYLDEATPVKVTTIEGEVLQGSVTWMGRWEFGMRLKKGAMVTVFRHALADIREA